MDHQEQNNISELKDSDLSKVSGGKDDTGIIEVGWNWTFTLPDGRTAIVINGGEYYLDDCQTIPCMILDEKYGVISGRASPKDYVNGNPHYDPEILNSVGL